MATQLRVRVRRYIFVGAALVTLGIVGIAAAEVSGLLSRDATTPPPVAIERPPVIGVFSRPQTSAETAAERMPAIAQAVAVLGGRNDSAYSGVDPGEKQTSVRILASGLGSSNRIIFAFRTDKGAICLGLSHFTSGCLAAVPRDIPITVTAGDPDQDGVGEGPIVWGFAKDSVRSVQVMVGGRTYQANLGENAYFFQAEDNRLTTEMISEVVATLEDGRNVTVPVGVDRPLVYPPVLSGGN